MAGVISNKYVKRYKHFAVFNKKAGKRPYRNLYLAGKRGFDIFLSLIITLTVLSWLMPLLAILIKIDSLGPVFFIQRRVGFMGREFKCLKMRTMVVNDYSDSLQSMENDPRITRLGHFLRMTSLDELPQFLNVLMGDMSIVGPRPFMKSDDDHFGQVINNYKLRYNAKPGITGMAQVKGYRGPTVSFHSIFHRYQWDAFYIRNACPYLDFKIIRLTASQTLKSICSFKFKRLRKLSMGEARFLLDNLR